MGILSCSIHSLTFGQTATTIQGSINDKDYPGYSLDSAQVYGKDLQDNEILFDTITDQQGNYYGEFFTVGVIDDGQKPLNFELNQNYPNPFNPSTKVVFIAEHQGNYTFQIFDVLGQQIFSQGYDLQKGQ